MSFNNNLYYNQDYLYPDTQCIQPISQNYDNQTNCDFQQYNVQQYNVQQYNVQQYNVQQYNAQQYNVQQYDIPQYEDVNSLLLDDNLFINDSFTPLSTPQLYYSPIPTEEYPELAQPWPVSQQWFDPPLMDEKPFTESFKKRKETPLEEKKYACPVCSHRSKRRHNMVEHMQTHNPNRSKSFSCQICQRAFARKYDMKRHEKIHFRQ
ncbi:hypothetical protein G6F56_008754 [Rhizopus delemar]|uniref:C2H2-type domain-containing protein n=1 Tax=Rhizopus stolonifer TaxID=4846 RepID=A0A367KJT5_RHIST|nr:hypothetical protein G6F56_008754 [Rhizopus delemar]RCI02418.1 hypothetical protein CU098_012108 [Rhizopus stolonifer]